MMTKERVLKALTLAALVWLTSVLPARAQADGRFAGTVLDASGAFVPGATVTVKNEKTGERTAVTARRASTHHEPQASRCHGSREVRDFAPSIPACSCLPGRIPSRSRAQAGRRPETVTVRARRTPWISARRGLASTSVSVRC